MAVKNIQTDQQRLAFALPYIEPWNLEWGSRCDLYLNFFYFFPIKNPALDEILLPRFLDSSEYEGTVDIDLASYAS